MLFVELGREVSPLNTKLREHKAVITGIKDNRFVVVLKQDRSHEVVRLKDIVLNDKVYDLEELKNESHEFFKTKASQECSSDFDRFKLALGRRIIDEMLKTKAVNQ